MQPPDRAALPTNCQCRGGSAATTPSAQAQAAHNNLKRHSEVQHASTMHACSLTSTPFDMSIPSELTAQTPPPFSSAAFSTTCQGPSGLRTTSQTHRSRAQAHALAAETLVRKGHTLRHETRAVAALSLSLTHNHPHAMPPLLSRSFL
eukprot:3722766-Rhodomonas_salina.1